MTVLISTYWNVKDFITSKSVDFKAVLISTYWNVKFTLGAGDANHDAGFNLNLLECKIIMNTNVFEK